MRSVPPLLSFLYDGPISDLTASGGITNTFSLVSREVIADTIETAALAEHVFITAFAARMSSASSGAL
jgi:dihydroxyacid dehydratase/phosphogluconate dehydratase